MSGLGVSHEGVDGKVRSHTLVKLLPTDGQLSRTDSTVSVQNASSVLLFVAFATGNDPVLASLYFQFGRY